MKVLFDIGHPAHVHLFSNLAKILVDRGHSVFFTCREKEFEKELLLHYQFPFYSFGKKRLSRWGKIMTLIKFEWQMLKIAIEFRPDIFVSHGSPYAAHVAFLLRRPHISMEDTGNMEQVRLYLPFSKVVLTPALFQKDLGPKQITYNGCHELAYLTEKYFKPNSDVLKKLGVSKADKYVVLRFVGWSATHDKDHFGMTDKDKLVLIQNLESLGYKVFLSSEIKLQEDLQAYRLNILPHEIFDVLSFSDLFVGEGATMAIEAAILGVKSIFVSSIRLRYIDELCKFKILKQALPDKINSEIKDLINSFGNEENHRTHWHSFLKDKVDVPEYFADFIENYHHRVK
jgi:predicted glycosyltransferase